MPLVRANRLRALAQTGATRLPIAAEIPTLHEAGLKGYNVTTWYTGPAPARVPASAVNYLNQIFVSTLRVPEVRARLQETGVDEIVGSTPALTHPRSSKQKQPAGLRS